MRKLVLVVLALSLMGSPAHAIGDVERGVIYGVAGILGLQHLSRHSHHRDQVEVRYYNYHHRDRYRNYRYEEVYQECVWIAHHNRRTGEIDSYKRFCR